jgi:hypothetical protein
MAAGGVEGITAHRRPGLPSGCAGELRLLGSGQAFLVNPDREFSVLVGVLEEIHDVLQLELVLFDAGDVLEADP